MTFPLLSNHFAEPSADTAYPDLIKPLQKVHENPEEFKGRPQKWSDPKSNPYKMNLKVSYLAKTVLRDYLMTVYK